MVNRLLLIKTTCHKDKVKLDSSPGFPIFYNTFIGNIGEPGDEAIGTRVEVNDSTSCRGPILLLLELYN